MKTGSRVPKLRSIVNHKVIGVIPARFASTRFPGKPLVNIAGKPLLQWVIEQAQLAQQLDEVIVATDHIEIARLSENLGMKAVMTDSDLPSGTDRIYAATKDMQAEIVINIQGDEPMLNPEWIDMLVLALKANPNSSMSTLAHPISEEDLENKNAVKVILNEQQQAIYFSRWPIPFSRKKMSDFPQQKFCMKHIGMYGYRSNFLKEFCQHPPSEIEQSESLEQLRALSMGASIQVISVAEASVGVDTPEDALKVEEYLKRK